jgi:hypothetical protein
MNGRVLILVLLCLPAWAVFNVLGPIQFLNAHRELGRIVHPVTLTAAAFFGLFISFATTPLAVIVAVFFVKTARSPREGLACIILGLSAILGTLLGYFWMGGGMRA